MKLTSTRNCNFEFSIARFWKIRSIVASCDWLPAWRLPPRGLSGSSTPERRLRRGSRHEARGLHEGEGRRRRRKRNRLRRTCSSAQATPPVLHQPHEDLHRLWRLTRGPGSQGSRGRHEEDLTKNIIVRGGMLGRWHLAGVSHLIILESGNEK